MKEPALRDIGVVIPVYNSASTLPAVVYELSSWFEARGLSFRIVLVDDGSADGSGALIDGMARRDGHITAVRLRENAGQQAALLCGLRQKADCRCYVTMDDDLQHPAPVLEALYQGIRQGYDLVYAIPRESSRPLWRRLGSLARDMLFDLCIPKPPGVRISSYRIMTAALTQKICAEPRSFVYLSASALLYRPRVANIPYRQPQRPAGRSGYTLGKLWRVYAGIFIHYTAAGRFFRPRSAQKPLYTVQSVTERTECREHADDPGRLPVPEERADRRPPDGVQNHTGGLPGASARGGAG